MTLNHSTLIPNMALLQLDDGIHNLLISFFKNRTHFKKIFKKTSGALSINSSVVQGSVLGPTSFFFIVFIGSSPDIRWKCYKNTANNRTKRELLLMSLFLNLYIPSIK